MQMPREEAYKELPQPIPGILQPCKATRNHRRAPIPTGGETEWLRFQNLIKEAMPDALK